MAINLCQRIAKGINGPVKGVLLDVTGVLYDAGQAKAIEGSVDAIEKLRSMNIPFRFVTNETQRTRKGLVSKLQSLGFQLTEQEIFAPGPAVSKYLKENDLHPYLLVHPDILPEFDLQSDSPPNCVVIGDAGDFFTYENMNKAFRVLMSVPKPILISMGKGKYYKEGEQLNLDVGGFTAALEYACGIKAEVFGKPFSEFFENALKDMEVYPDEAVMVGDDIISDVGAAQNCGMQGVLVRTGKFRPCDENNETIKPNAIFSNLLEFVEFISKSK